MQTILLEDFETDGNTAGGGSRYTTSTGEFLAGSDNSDYFTRTDGTSPAVSGTYLGASGAFFAVADTNGSSNALDTQTLTFAAVDITNFTNLSISGLFAEDTASNGLEDWDDNTQVFIEVSIDGGAFEKVLQFASLGVSPTDSNDAPGLDADFDGNADAADLTDTFSTFSGSIAGTGSSMVIRVVFENLQAGDEDIAIDDIELTGTALIVGDDGNNSLTGTADADSILGGGGVDFISAGDGNDIIDGQTGSDAIDAGEGEDTVFGDAARDILFGAGGADVLYGGDGADMLMGGTDADQMFGGSGIDEAFYNAGVTVDMSDGARNTGDAVGDTFDSVEVLRGADGSAYDFTGDGASNTLLGADQGDSLFGGDGADWLDGRGGADTLDGGAGNDRFIVDDAGDVLIEAEAGGYDRAIVSLSYTLSDNIEAANALGFGNIDLTGNDQNNWLNGNSGNNILDGGAGNDRIQAGDSTDFIIGGTGNDNLYGQSGIDIFVFTDGDGLDVIRDFEAFEVIDFTGASVASFDALDFSDHALGTMIDYGTGRVIVAGVTSDELTEGNFGFS